MEGDASRSAPDRAALREAMSILRMAELREGLWGRPHNLPDSRSPDAAGVARRWCRWWTGARADPAPAADELWDLDGWAVEAADLRSDMAGLSEALEAGDASALAEGFLTSAAVLRHLQADPLLPAALLPTEWPGEPLRADYDRFDAAYRAVLRSWFATA